jgi:hypothetical protein
MSTPQSPQRPPSGPKLDPRDYEIDPESLTTAPAVSDALRKLRAAKVNIIGPPVHLATLPLFHSVSITLIHLSPYDPPMVAKGNTQTKSNGLWYDQKGGGVSIHGTALRMLAQSCGVKWLYFRRVDKGLSPLYWRFEGSATIPVLTGDVYPVMCHYESDLRDSSPEIAGMSEPRVVGLRQKGLVIAESKGKNRVLREVLCVQQVYTIEEANRPFAFLSLVKQLPSDPEVLRLLQLQSYGLLGDLYGGLREVIDVSPSRQAPALPAPVDGVDFAAENARLNARERVEVLADPDADEIDDDGGGEPWGPPAPTPAADWSGYTLEQVRDFLAANDRPDPSREGPDRQEQIRAWLGTAGGKRQIDAFLAATSKRGGQ